ncbi:Hsp33 family molecular chaperone HslO [Halomonas eurihalina]|uniref:33 kDa chaperonin n=1 Tax=Halomonas eurihalina TaxID=42566 RepID=A0A5D9D8N8_HALER|nr:Hsp33 family molecular chaperone HslO [Halomonas eurihalina]MDR5860657.1 Hsp33 family molecular chaperone HslO [Halomonas eurihalina]TZG40117.1 Hsp33 family molecular chaperone HslO [Halomonas eurihalina]
MTDQIQRFLFDNTNVRGEVVSLEKAYAEVLERHDYPPAVTRQLGELLAAVALLTETVKLDGTMSIEVRGKGALSLLMAESNPGGELRAIAQLDEDAAIPGDDAGFAELFGEGQITITLDPREGRRYQGIVTLERDNLAGCLEDYFSRSEQLPTRIWLAADSQRSAGLLLQRLPDESLNQDEDAWERMVQLAATLTAYELLSLEQHDLLHRLFHEEQARVFEPKALHFGCSCSRERIAGALLSLGNEELREILAEQGGIATQCHFCHTRYQFTVAEVEAMLDDPDGPPPTVH